MTVEILLDDSPEVRVQKTIQNLSAEFGDDIDWYMIVESLVDSECARGDYEGCSPELEMAYSEYESIAKRLLARGD